MEKKRCYDIIVSLGGSCATAKQLYYNNLRKCSFPFDWLFHWTNETIEYLIYAFEYGFDDWMIKENLKDVDDWERGDSKLFQYKDTVSGYCSIHDFNKPFYDEGEYQSVIDKYHRRIERMLDYISRSKKVLFILDARYQVRVELLNALRMVVCNQYPGLDLEITLLQFNSDCSTVTENRSVRVINIPRNQTGLDYNGSPPEWNFLKTISLSDVIFDE